VNTESAKAAVLGVGVQFRRAGKVYLFTTTDTSFKANEPVVVEAEGGTAIGLVASPPHEAAEGQLPQNAKKLLRRATAEEIEAEAQSREKALECFEICRDMVRERQLPMKPVDAQIEENGKKIVFVFYAEQRVDFRNLVKDLAGRLHMRIEMRQIGSRDEAKVHGCIASCGQETCCSLHLRQFQSISISMAKHQGLAPNPAKLTGMCGKLKCCLAYEHAVYDEYRKGLHKAGSAVTTPQGSGKIIGHNVLRRECVVRLYAGGEIRCPNDSCTVLTPTERDAALEATRRSAEKADERPRQRREQRSNRESRSRDRGKKTT
jgi:cell fate regulator YaaT (PSP1 superfamily)